MGVQLNIKDAATVELARTLADATGRSVTETIRHALERERTARETERAEFHRRVKDISTQFRAHMPPDWHHKTSHEIMEEVYDDDEPSA